MSLTVNPSSSNKKLAPPSSKQDPCNPYQKVAKYLLDHYDLIEAPQFKNMSLEEVLKQKPAILLGEDHDNQKHREYHGWIINQLHHDQAILLTEGEHDGQHLQTAFIDLDIIKKSKSWDDSELTYNILKWRIQHQFTHLNAIRTAIYIMNGESFSDRHFDCFFRKWLEKHIDRTPKNANYKKLKSLLYSPWDTDKEEKFKAFLVVMINLINHADTQYENAIFQASNKRDGLFIDNLQTEIDRGLQPLAIAGEAHIDKNAYVVQTCISKNIPFISCLPKARKQIATPNEQKKQTSLEIIEENILKAKYNIEFTGPMSTYQLHPILAEYCKLKLAELEEK